MATTAELKKIRDDLYSRKTEISLRYAEAERAYTDAVVADMLAEYAARGITEGCLVNAIRKDYSGNEKVTKATFLGVEKTSWGSTKVVLGALKKDGSPSKSRRYVQFDRLEPVT